MSDHLEAIRLATVHPLFVHATLGTLPLILSAYAIAVARRSEHWTFVGDMALVVTALITLLTAAFGLVSNALLQWPGTAGSFRALHLGFGIASAVLLVAFAALRMRVRALRRALCAGPRTLAFAISIAACIGFTGWIGGEVLVYHSGMAVSAAAQGALAPPIRRGAPKPTGDILESMHRLRAEWAAVQTALAASIVERPSQRGFTTIEHAAERIASIARDVETHAKASEEQDLEFLAMANRLAQKADALARGSRARDPAQIAESDGALTAACASCHERERGPAHGRNEKSAHAAR